MLVDYFGLQRMRGEKYMIKKILRFMQHMLHKRKERNLYSSFISPQDLVFDVGANIGEHTEVFLELGAKVVCIEPQESCIKHLRKKFKNNKNVVIVKKGLSAEVGMLPLFICEEANTISTFSEKWKTGRFRNYQWNKKVEVSVTTLDELIKKYGVPSFCKIDVEGYDLQVLHGLSSKIPCISFEFTVEFLDDAKSCVEYLSSLGTVKFNFCIGASMKLHSDKWLTSKELFDKLASIGNENLWGDIYAKFEENI